MPALQSNLFVLNICSLTHFRILPNFGRCILLFYDKQVNSLCNWYITQLNSNSRSLNCYHMCELWLKLQSFDKISLKTCSCQKAYLVDYFELNFFVALYEICNFWFQGFSTSLSVNKSQTLLIEQNLEIVSNLNYIFAPSQGHLN